MAAPKGNKFALGNTGGRPPKYKSGKVLSDKIDEYFQSLYTELEDPDTGETVWEIAEKPTVTGLALFLGFCDKSSLYDYKSKRQVFSHPIKRALLAIEHWYEKGLQDKSPTGAIFALKNMGWKDKVETDITSKGEKVDQSPITVIMSNDAK